MSHISSITKGNPGLATSALCDVGGAIRLPTPCEFEDVGELPQLSGSEGAEKTVTESDQAALADALHRPTANTAGGRWFLADDKRRMTWERAPVLEG